jgi:hypothetical protein
MTTDAEISTKDRPGVYDAIETAKSGEPLFPIQGGDPFGPPTVQFWVDQCRRAGMAEEDPKRAAALLDKASSAERVMWAMQAYQRGVENEQGPTVKPDSRPAYSGWTDTADEETQLRRRQRAGRIAATGKLHNSVAAAAEAADSLAQLRVCPEAEVKVREAIEALKEAARDVEPRRGQERT